MFNSRGLQVAAIALVLLASFAAELPGVASEDLAKSVEKAASDAAAAVQGAVSPKPKSSFAEMVEESWKSASQTLQGYADKVAAQLPKRSKRWADGASPSEPAPSPETADKALKLAQEIREICMKGLEKMRKQPPELAESTTRPAAGGAKDQTVDARDVLRNIRLRCTEILNVPNRPEQPVASRSRRQASAPAEKQQQQEAPSPVATLLNNGQAAWTKFSDQVRDQTAAAMQQFQTVRDQLAPKPRTKRQVQYPNLDQAQQPQQPQASGQPSSGGAALKFISDLGQQAQQAQAISQFVQAATQQSGASPANGASSGSGANVAQMLTQLTDLIKSTQNRNERLLESGQRNLEAANQQTMEMAKSAQTGVQAALSDLTSGLQRLASNNPNLVPDIKSLYQSVSSKLSPNSASSAPIPASGPNQSMKAPAVAQS